MVWADGDALSPTNLNLRGESASSVGGYSTNTLKAESGSIISSLGYTLKASAVSSVGTTIVGALWTSNVSVGSSSTFRGVDMQALTATTGVFSGSTVRVAEAGTGGGLAGDATGTAGDIAWGSSSNVSFLYVCVSANSWMRTALLPF